MPAPHHSVFYKPDALPDPTNSIKALKAQNTFLSKIYETP